VKSLCQNNYATYVRSSTGLKEGHGRRLLAFCALAIICTVFGKNSVYDAYSVLVTSITILTGFTFTALFSDHTMADIGLPSPSDENDRQDLKSLGLLGNNFKARSSYFIALSIIAAIFMTVASIKLSVPTWLQGPVTDFFAAIASYTTMDIGHLFGKLKSLISACMTALVVFMYLECLYTFYRLSETILAIVNVRRNYIKHAETRSS
jgi:hypothetical protein